MSRAIADVDERRVAADTARRRGGYKGDLKTPKFAPPFLIQRVLCLSDLQRSRLRLGLRNQSRSFGMNQSRSFGMNQSGSLGIAPPLLFRGFPSSSSSATIAHLSKAIADDTIG